MRRLYVDMIYTLVMRVRQKIVRVTLYACLYHHAGDCVHQKILFLGMNYVTFVFLFLLQVSVLSPFVEKSESHVSV